MPASLEQLQPALEGRQQLDLVAERDPRMRVERDDRRRSARCPGRLDHAPVAEVDAVEGADARPRAAGARALGDAVRDRSARRLLAVAARSASVERLVRRIEPARVGRLRPENGPTSVRRSVAQWPPSASAIARTYVPELTRRSSVTVPPV